MRQVLIAIVGIYLGWNAVARMKHTREASYPRTTTVTKTEDYYAAAIYILMAAAVVYVIIG